MKKVASTVLIAFVTLFAFGVLINTQTCHAQTNVELRNEQINKALETTQQSRGVDPNVELLTSANKDTRDKLLTEQYILANLNADRTKMLARHVQETAELQLNIAEGDARSSEVEDLTQRQRRELEKLDREINNRLTNIAMLQTLDASESKLLSQKIELVQKVANDTGKLSDDEQIKLAMRQLSNDLAFDSIEDMKEFVNEKISDTDHLIASDKRAWNN